MHSGGRLGGDESKVFSQRIDLGGHAGHWSFPAVGESRLDFGETDQVVQTEFVIGTRYVEEWAYASLIWYIP